MCFKHNICGIKFQPTSVKTQTEVEYLDVPVHGKSEHPSPFISHCFPCPVCIRCVCELFTCLFSSCAPRFLTYTQQLLVFTIFMHCVERALCFLNRAFPFGGHDGYHRVKMRYLHEIYRLALCHELGGHLTDDAGRSLEKESNLLQSC